MKNQKQGLLKVILCIAGLFLLFTGCEKDQISPKIETDKKSSISAFQNGRIPPSSVLLKDQPTLAERYAEKGLQPHQANSVEILEREVETNPNIALEEVVRGNSASYKIYPTGIFPDDWANIQSVTDLAGLLDQDAKVLLMGQNTAGIPTAFNFGFGDFGEGTGDLVTISGSSSGQSGTIRYQGVGGINGGTTISGGIAIPLVVDLIYFNYGFLLEDREAVEFNNIQFVNNCALNAELAPAPQPGDIVVKNCHFEDFNGWPIFFWNSTGKTIIKNNTFLNYNGRVSILRNLDGCVIQNNVINTDGLAGFEVLNIGGALVKGNDLTCRANHFGWTSAIDIYSTDPASPAYVLNNEVSTEAQGITCIEFFGSLNDVIIEQNTVEILPNPLSSFRIPFVVNSNGGPVENICITNNTASGTGYWAVEVASQATFWGGDFGDLFNVVVTGNDLEQFNSNCEIDYLLEDLGLSACVDVFIDATVRDSYVCQEGADVADLGTNNTVSDDEDDCPECD